MIKINPISRVCKITSIIISITLIFSIVTEAQAALLIHYKMDETSGIVVTDSSGNGHHGTVIERTTNEATYYPQWSKLGKIKGAIHFRKNGHVSVPASGFSSLSEQFSICFWTYGDQILGVDGAGTEADPDGDPAIIIDSESSTGWRVIRVEMPNSDKIVFNATNDTNYQSIKQNITDAELKGSWHHWTFVKNATTGDMKIYLDGTPWLSATGKNLIPSVITEFLIGVRCDKRFYYYGLVDDFRVYDHMLSETEIQQLVSHYTVNFQAAANGRVEGSSAQKITSGENTTTVTAVPNAGYIFDGWTGGYTGTKNPLIINGVHQTLTITANFVADTQPETTQTVNGLLDEVHVFDQALSADDVSNLFFQGPPYNHYGDTAQLFRNKATYDLSQETYEVELVWSALANAHSQDSQNFRSYHYHPQTVTYKNYTYVVYIDPDNLPMVAKINNDDPTQVMIRNLDTDYGEWLNDGHHTITIGVDKDGHLHVSGDMHNYSVYSSEGHMPESYQNGHCNYWRSDSPEDISSFTWLGDQQKKAPQGRGFTYMGFFNDMYGELYYYSRLSAAGSIRVFGMSRYDAATGDWSTLGGTTLDDPYLKMIYEDNDEVSPGYTKIQSTGIFDRNNRLHIAANILNSETGPDFDPNFEKSHYSTDIVYMRSDNGLAGWVKGDGTSSPMPARVETGPDQGDVVVTWKPATFAFQTHSSVAFDINNNPIVLADTKTSDGGGHLVMAWDDETNGWVNKGDMGYTDATLHQAFTDPAGVVNMIVNNDNKLVRFWSPDGSIREVTIPAEYGELKGYDREYVKLTGNIQGIVRTAEGKIGLLRIKINRPSITPPTLPDAKASWLMEETDITDTVADSTGNGYIGQRLGSPEQNRIIVDGQEGRALGFDGTDDAVLVSSLDWTPTNFSVAFWMHPAANGDYSQVLRAENGWGAFMFHSSAAGEIYVGTDKANKMGPDELPPGTLVADEWQHFVFTYDNGTGRLYRNGSLAAKKSGMQAPLAWTGFLMGEADAADYCPDNPAKTDPGTCGCGVPDTDSDDDGTPDCIDECPNEAAPHSDDDGDGTPNCTDGCPDDMTKIEPGICGCNTTDDDSDDDGTTDCTDGCPDDQLKTDPGTCGCGVPDTDTDSDGTPDCVDTDDDNDGVPDAGDAFPIDPNETVDSDGDGWGDNQDQFPDNKYFSQPDNIIDNPGAELDDNDWSIASSENGTALIKDDTAHTGSKYFYLDGVDPDSDDVDLSGDIQWRSKGYTMPDGVQTYHFQGWMKTVNTTRTRIQANVTNEASVVVRQKLNTDSGNNDWMLYSYSGKEDTDIASFTVWLVQAGIEGQRGLFDDVALFVVIPNDNDSDGIDDSIDPDDDDDGVKDGSDAFPFDAGEYVDTDGDGIGNNADDDDDGDGVLDVDEGKPDTDNDGTPDGNDGCPNDSNKTEPGACGCGNPDTDSDSDGTPDCNDGSVVLTPPELVEAIPHQKAGITDDLRIPNTTSFAVRLKDTQGINITDTTSVIFTINDGVNAVYIRDLSDDNVIKVLKLANDVDEAVTDLWVTFIQPAGTTYVYDTDINIKLDAQDNSGAAMDQKSFYFRIESEAKHNEAAANVPSVANIDPNDSELVGTYDEGIQVTSGDLKGCKILYNSNEPVKPTIGPKNELPPLEVHDVNAVAIPINFQPPTVFVEPVIIRVPCSGHTDVNDLNVYVFNGTQWLLACDAEGNVQPGGDGWMVPNSRVNRNDLDPIAIEVQVYHFTGVQAGNPAQVDTGTDGGGGGDGGGTPDDNDDGPAGTPDNIILTDDSPNTILVSSSVTQVYGSVEANNITINSGAKAELFNFPGSNIITIEADSSIFTVSRSGAYVTFEGTDGTVLKIPATLESQTIVFSDGSLSLVINAGKILLGDQEISLTASEVGL